MNLTKSELNIIIGMLSSKINALNNSLYSASGDFYSYRLSRLLKDDELSKKKLDKKYRKIEQLKKCQELQSKFVLELKSLDKPENPTTSPCRLVKSIW